MSRNEAEWSKRPQFPQTHYVNSAIYTDDGLFKEEQSKIFNKCWIIACHESELPSPYDYRTFQHPGGAPLIVVRGEDMKIRTFLNICPHRGNTLLYEPVGNAKRITCIFHAWSFDTAGRCIDISRGKQGYQDRFGCDQAGLREIRTEQGFGGFVWVNMDDGACTLREYIGDAMQLLDEHLEAPLEVFHYHKAVVPTNYKLWHDTNSEFYHDYMHYFNRATGMMQPGYFDRKYTGYPNGHASVGSMTIKYDAYDGSKERGVGWPGLAPGGWVLIDIFPGMTYNLRTSVLRMDTAVPLGPDKLVIEFRGLGLKSDTPEQRAERIRDHNVIWGPFGRNLHEDLLGVYGQGRAMRERSGSHWVIHGREEHSTIHDEVGMRHFYAEWSRRMGRLASDPFAESGSAQRAA
ncbi:aromatic ring-hydroxylating dioxygenase subunit alpha [uncultured Azohydromonas sp.]|jgi:Phenylpropionate dioxygenase and related ring-hydroxylating dioxygenases, large terminal subunit|uniref:aromatic ring-hydroxylating oxygenase subunit alpha n=1 Tax=uncultured Azohydromonas sp. TaxID=487342 RepID=UPI002604FE99|nr:aromatic ring-hydroxylating dioxygenase subunit alpha [uncultured Azohydromonas sp.]